MAAVSILSGLSALSILYVPQAREFIHLTDDVEGIMFCKDDKLQFTGAGFTSSKFCKLKPNLKLFPTTLQISDCIFTDEVRLRFNNNLTIPEIELVETHNNMYAINCGDKDSECYFDLVPGMSEESNMTFIAGHIHFGSSFKDTKVTVEKIKSYTNGSFSPIKCRNYDLESKESATYQCKVSLVQQDICASNYYLKDINVTFTFWLYLILRLLFGVFISAYFMLLEGAVMTILTQYKSDLGLQRLWGSFGGMIFAPLSGVLMDYYSKGKSQTDYR